MKVKINTLNRSIKEELFNMYAMFTNPYATETEFYQKSLNVVEIDLNSVDKEILYQLDDESVNNYLKITDNEETKYAIVSDGKLVDGLHRISSKIKVGELKMFALDASGLINVDPYKAGSICNISYNEILQKRKVKLKR